MHFEPNKTYILDGALGTELQRRGIPTTLPLWSAQALYDHPNIVKDIHQEYILAGADIITTNTFRTQRRSLAKANKAADTERINAVAVDLAVQARAAAKADRPIYIAGSMTTLEDCYRVDLVPDDATLLQEHTEQASLLAATPIDLFLLETFNTIREAKAAAQAASETYKPIVISFVINTEGNLLSGESLADAVQELNQFHPLAYLVNCVPTTVATLGLKLLRAATDLPIGAYANGDGRPDDDQGWKFTEQDLAQDYYEQCRQWKEIGAQIIGGCCGTNPEYTKMYSRLK